MFSKYFMRIYSKYKKLVRYEKLVIYWYTIIFNLPQKISQFCGKACQSRNSILNPSNVF